MVLMIGTYLRVRRTKLLKLNSYLGRGREGGGHGYAFCEMMVMDYKI